MITFWVLCNIFTTRPWDFSTTSKTSHLTCLWWKWPNVHVFKLVFIIWLLWPIIHQKSLIGPKAQILLNFGLQHLCVLKSWTYMTPWVLLQHPYSTYITCADVPLGLHQFLRFFCTNWLGFSDLLLKHNLFWTSINDVEQLLCSDIHCICIMLSRIRYCEWVANPGGHTDKTSTYSFFFPQNLYYSLAPGQAYTV